MENAVPKISVIIPIFNMEKYLRECLDSVLNQTLKDIEIICVNDGSTDNSLKILREYQDKYANIKLISRENRGVSFSRNEAIKSANGEYVCFVDPDDFYPANDILETLYNAATSNNVKIAGGEFSYYDSRTGKLSQKFGKTEDGYAFQGSAIIKYNDYQFDYGFHRFIYQKDFLLNNNLYFPDLIRFEDPIFFVLAMYMAGEFYSLDKITYAYRTQHKEYKFDDLNLEHALRGIIRNLSFAKKNNLNKLKYYTEARIKQHCNLYNRIIPNRTNIVLLLRVMQLSPKIFLYFLHTILCNVFSLKNTRHGNIKHKMVTILGIKIKFKRRIINAES